MTAQEIIALRNRELSGQSNARSLWQDTADYMYPYVNIDCNYEAGTARTNEIYDVTPMLDSLDMVSGLKYILLPSGQNFFAVKSTGGIQTDNAQRYISYVTEVAHEKIYGSNFITEFDEVLRSMILFGPASLYSEWTKRTGLNYRTQVIGTYQLLEDCKKNVNGIIISVNYTASQAVQEFGEKNVGSKVLECAKDPKKENEIFEFIYLCRERDSYGKTAPDVSSSKPYESIIVNVKEQVIVDEGGFDEFPYHTARWFRPANEKDGRGIGTEILPQVKVLCKMMKEFIECGNKWNNPPREVLYSFEGDVRVTPGAVNVVQEMGSIKALEGNLIGNFPITEKSLDRQTEIIHRAFFRNAFSPLEDLTGDRRTTLEIRERIKQSWPKIGPPIGRIWAEMLSPCITRSIMLLIRNGELPMPPAELQGANFGIEFVGPFALELRSQQAKAFQEWVTFVGNMEAVFPGAIDNVDADDAIMRMGRTFGVNTEDMATQEERDAKRQARAEQQLKMEQLQAMETVGNTYNKGTKAPEDGSATQKIMQDMGV